MALCTASQAYWSCLRCLHPHSFSKIFHIAYALLAREICYGITFAHVDIRAHNHCKHSWQTLKQRDLGKSKNTVLIAFTSTYLQRPRSATGAKLSVPKPVNLPSIKKVSAQLTSNCCQACSAICVTSVCMAQLRSLGCIHRNMLVMTPTPSWFLPILVLGTQSQQRTQLSKQHQLKLLQGHPL